MCHNFSTPLILADFTALLNFLAEILCIGFITLLVNFLAEILCIGFITLLVNFLAEILCTLLDRFYKIIDLMF